ncbi:diphosphoinositol polyphosphate phosphohydrolase 2 [Platysternon megacephalum]|uniref:Diphosphoinositol polyphosphate phosphohydrolase 2 n=1 Tax=Platysternon megacephalum TaxID=55544 RepID=A0A4D9E4U9_9SAUR|nr:diphosphoinositol polyphosphate phosphohydrolase 2 [Platysternon megacephalum]
MAGGGRWQPLLCILLALQGTPGAGAQGPPICCLKIRFLAGYRPVKITIQPGEIYIQETGECGQLNPGSLLRFLSSGANWQLLIAESCSERSVGTGRAETVALAGMLDLRGIFWAACIPGTVRESLSLQVQGGYRMISAQVSNEGENL